MKEGMALNGGGLKVISLSMTSDELPPLPPTPKATLGQGPQACGWAPPGLQVGALAQLTCPSWSLSTSSTGPLWPSICLYRLCRLKPSLDVQKARLQGCPVTLAGR